MNSIFKHTIFWLLLSWLSATNLKPLFLPETTTYQQKMSFDVHHDALPDEGKQEQTEPLKTFARYVIQRPLHEFDTKLVEHFDYPHCSKRKVYLPIILPPPKIFS